MLASLVQFKYVQTISELNDVNFVVGLADGFEYELTINFELVNDNHLEKPSQPYY